MNLYLLIKNQIAVEIVSAAIFIPVNIMKI